MKNIGIIGGLGPMATVYFMELIIGMTESVKDQDHARIYLQSIPDTPDRTAYICGKSQNNPLPYMVEAGISLAKQGADFIAIPCVTAQYFYEGLSKNIPIPVIPLVSNIATEIKRKGIDSVGIMATNGTVESQVLQKEFQKNGIHVVLPSKRAQEQVMDIIYNQIKAGKQVNLEEFYSVGEELKSFGAQINIIGCTELSLIKKEQNIGSDYIDVLEELAKDTIRFCGAPLRKEICAII